MSGMTPTYWLILGVALIIIEVTVPGLVVVFFGLSALVVALLTWLIPSLPDGVAWLLFAICLLYTSPSPRDRTRSRMPSSA